MIKKLLSVLIVAVALNANAQQVQNPGFELWTSSFPNGWGSFDQMLVGLGQPNPGGTTQTTTKNSGTYAALLTSQTVALAGGVVPGIAVTGPVVLGGGGAPVLGREAFAGQPTSYTFYYEFVPVGTDTAFTQVVLSKWNTGMNKRDTLAIGGVVIGGAVGTYTQKTVTLTWLKPMTNSDSIQLLFASTKHNTSSAVAGTKFYVDDVNMISGGSSVQTLMADGSFVTAYPNPASTMITISSTDEKAKYAKVYDLTGRLVNTYELTNKLTKIDVSSYENGMYIYIVTDEHGNNIHSAKFNVAK